jgi:hypothetical protein
MKFIIIIAFSLMIISGCGSSTTTTKTNQTTENKSCINELTKESVIRWGGHNMKTQKLSGWQLDANSILFEFTKDGKDSEYKFKEIGKVDIEKFCELYRTAQKYFLEIQALNAPGDSSHFVEIINPITKTNLRAVWNVRFKTYGSQEFRALFDSLQVIADREYNIFLEKGSNPGNSAK